MAIKKLNKTVKKTSEVFLPLDVYENLVRDAQEYKELQEREGIRWVSVRVNTSAKKKIKKV